MTGNATPIFLFSLPRSGSTLLQRILSGHREIASVPESWLLVLLGYVTKSEGVVGEYSHRLATRAIRDMIERLPEGKDSWDRSIETFVQSVFNELCAHGETYFLEKTPRNALVVEEVLTTFKEAKFLFLWRNPIEVVASMLHSSRNVWRLGRYEVDLAVGYLHLIEAHSRFRDRCHSVRFEDLLESPEDKIGELCAWLGLPFDFSIENALRGTSIRAGMGDWTGLSQYGYKISSEPEEKWRATLCNPLRVGFARRIVEEVGQDRLRSIGYDYDELISSLTSLPAGLDHIGGDSIRLLRSMWRKRLQRSLWASRGPSTVEWD